MQLSSALKEESKLDPTFLLPACVRSERWNQTAKENNPSAPSSGVRISVNPLRTAHNQAGGGRLPRPGCGKERACGRCHVMDCGELERSEAWRTEVGLPSRRALDCTHQGMGIERTRKTQLITVIHLALLGARKAVMTSGKGGFVDAPNWIKG